MENQAVKSPAVKQDFAQEETKQVTTLKPVNSSTNETSVQSKTPQWMTVVEDRSMELAEGVNKFIQEYPLRSVSIAVVAGLALNLFVRKMGETNGTV